MADVFGTGKRGCFHLITTDASGGRGGVLSLPGAGAIPSAPTDPFLVTSVRLVRNEILSHNKTFGGAIYSYAFGHDPNSSILDVGFTAFVGGNAPGAALATLDGHYKASRVSVALETASFSLGGSGAIIGYVVGMQSTTQNPELGLQDFSIRLSLPEVT